MPTPHWSLPFPAGADNPAIHTAIQALATALDDVTKYSQGTFATRPVSSGGSPGISGRFYYSTDTKMLSYDYGTGWIDIPIDRLWNESLTPPSSPKDGDIWVFRAAGSGELWIFRFLQSAIVYKWEFIGGSPLKTEIATAEPFGDNTAYTDATSVGPDVTVPRNGQYHVEFGFDGSGSTSGTVIVASPKLAGLTTSDAQSAGVLINSVWPMHAHRRIWTPTMTLGDLIRLQYKRVGTAGGTPTVQRRYISITPVRVL